MSSIGHGGGLRLTPRHRLYPPANATRSQDDDRLQLCLKTVIGTTTTSANAFDSSPSRHCFVYCAGPAAIVSQAHEDFSITQRLFRARPNALPINATPSYYNPHTPPTTPTRSRQGSPFKEAAFTNGHGATLEYIPDSPGTRRSQNRVREATCVSIGRQGDFLAVGETGYNPRVLVFSTAQDAPTDVPLSALTDHSFGVQSVAVSHDSRWLCSLGNSYDGFLLLYSLNAKTGATKLHSSNKCSNVHAIFWMGNTIVSFGTRHVKVWRVESSSSPIKRRLAADAGALSVESPGPKAFSGRNCILGPLIDATFTAAVAISDDQAILGTSQGDVCLLNDANRTQEIFRVARLPFGIQSVYCDHHDALVWIGGNHGQLEALPFDDLRTPCEPNSNGQPDLTTTIGPWFVAVGAVRDQLVTVDSNRVIEIREKNARKRMTKGNRILKKLSAHESAVLGVCSLLHWPSRGFGDILTYSARGTALLWKLDGTCCGNIELPLGQESDTFSCDPNEIKTTVASDSEEVLLVGDKLGLVSLVNGSGSTIASVQAHRGDINGVATGKTERHSLVCTCGRDRTLQLFKRTANGMSLVQTLDDHAASVTDLMFLEDVSSLVSISSDRTILVRKAAFGEGDSIAFLPVRVITLKASPVSFANVPFEPNIIVVSTMDRQIQRYDISSGRLLQSFKASDPVTNDSVLANSLQVATIGPTDDRLRVILAVSSTDKSIRLHDYESCALLTREHGQIAVSAVRLLHQDQHDIVLDTLVSCGLDGTIIVYEVNAQQLSQRNSNPPDSPLRIESPLKQTPTSTHPMRKTLTRTEIASFQKALEQGQGDTISPLRSPSPSRIRKKPSRYSLANPPRASTIPPTTTNYMSSTGSSQRKSSQDHSPNSASPKSTIKAPKPKSRPSLDHRHRSKSVANLNDLNLSAEQLCESLRVFRKRITSSVADKLKPDMAKELQLEIESTLEAMRTSSASTKAGGPGASKPLTGDLLDAYLARMIDERLALKANAKENLTPAPVDEQAQAGALIEKEADNEAHSR